MVTNHKYIMQGAPGALTINNGKKKTGAGVLIQVNKPLHRLAFWATTTTLCPENFIFLKLAPGEEETWVSEYTLFLE